MPDARCTRGPVCKKEKKTHTSIQVQRRQSGIPCAMALRLTSRSPRRRIPFVTVASGLRFVLSPVGPTRLRWLDISHGCQNHATSPYAAPPTATPIGEMPTEVFGEGLETPVVCADVGSLTGEPALRPRSRPTPLRPPHPTPRP